MEEAKGKGLSGLSLLMIAYVYFDIKVDNISFLGVDFENISESKLLIAWIMLFSFFLFRYWQSYLELDSIHRHNFYELHKSDFHIYIREKNQHIKDLVHSLEYERGPQLLRTSRPKPNGGYVYFDLKSLKDYKKLYFNYIIRKRLFLTIFTPFIIASFAIILSVYRFAMIPLFCRLF